MPLPYLNISIKNRELFDQSINNEERISIELTDKELIDSRISNQEKL